MSSFVKITNTVTKTDCKDSDEFMIVPLENVRYWEIKYNKYQPDAYLEVYYRNGEHEAFRINGTCFFYQNGKLVNKFIPKFTNGDID